MSNKESSKVEELEERLQSLWERYEELEYRVVTLERQCDVDVWGGR